MGKKMRLEISMLAPQKDAHVCIFRTSKYKQTNHQKFTSLCNNDLEPCIDFKFISNFFLSDWNAAMMRPLFFINISITMHFTCTTFRNQAKHGIPTNSIQILHVTKARLKSS